MLVDFFIHALVAGIILAIVAAPLGCFVVWRGMAYFGDTVAHSALLGVVLGLAFDIPFELSIIPIAVCIALLLTKLQHGTQFSTDTLLGILAHMGLAIGVVLLALNPQIRIDIMAYLFGDILAVSANDLLAMYALATMIILTLWFRWKQFILITLNEDIARLQKIPVERYRLILMLMIAVTVAISIKLVGLLLITSMLILPAATARYYSRSPVAMACVAILMAVMSVGGGLFSSFLWDTPSGPSIVLMAGLFFLVAYTSHQLTLLRRRRQPSE